MVNYNKLETRHFKTKCLENNELYNTVYNAHSLMINEYLLWKIQVTTFIYTNPPPTNSTLNLPSFVSFVLCIKLSNNVYGYAISLNFIVIRYPRMQIGTQEQVAIHNRTSTQVLVKIHNTGGYKIAIK